MFFDDHVRAMGDRLSPGSGIRLRVDMDNRPARGKNAVSGHLIVRRGDQPFDNGCRYILLSAPNSRQLSFADLGFFRVARRRFAGLFQIIVNRHDKR
jgi:hypothetical protein